MERCARQKNVGTITLHSTAIWNIYWVDNFKEQITVYLIMMRDFSTTAILCKNLPSQNQRTQGHKLADMSDILLHSMSGAALKKEIKLIISK